MKNIQLTLSNQIPNRQRVKKKEEKKKTKEFSIKDIPPPHLFDFALTDDEMAKITALDKQKRYYTSTPEMLKKYAEMVPPVDEQK